MKKTNITLSMVTLTISMLFSSLAFSMNAPTKAWTFSYKTAKNMTLQIKKSAPTYESAFKLAAKECFQKLTNGQYPGEERGLDIIDICANPKS